MALLSMTGYGQGRASRDGLALTVEINCLNGRFFDVNLRLPKLLQAFEPQVRKQMQQALVRGKVSVTASYAEEDGALPALTLNEGRLIQYQQLFRRMKEKLELAEEPGLSHYTSLHDIFVGSEIDRGDVMTELFQQALSEALENVRQMRYSEGENLGHDLRERLDQIERVIGNIEHLAEADRSGELQRYSARIQDLLGEIPVDEARLVQEAAILADKRDISEECTRLKSHRALFDQYMEADEPGGKRLSFLVQEMNREANTIGAKSIHIDISHHVVELKDELEKIREQVQNVL
ncbi:MAG: YicC/YloC family endoribonuclease [Candidatus Neomarinimicrobiota bacterium]